VNELPLLDLFTRLRELGLPLGIRDYEGVLRALQAGYGLPDRAALARLCRTLWVRSSEERELFDYYFEQLIDREIVSTISEAVKPVIEIGETVQSVITPGSVPTPDSQIISATPKKQQRAILIAICAGAIGILIAGAGVTLWNNTRRQTTVQIAPSPSPIPTKPSIVNEPMQATWRLGDAIFLLKLSLGSFWVIRFMMQRRQRSSYTSVPIPDKNPSKQPPDSDRQSDTPIPNPVENIPNLTTQMLRVMGDEVLTALVVQEITRAAQPITTTIQLRSRDRFVLSGDYLPITQWQMKQSWRHLRRMVREGIATELDLDRTVSQIASKGILLEPVLAPRKVNRTELILLIDRDGSMVAFHALADRLIETALMGGRLGKAGTYYFKNCPVGYLYHDRVHSNSEPVAELLAKLQRDRTVVLIFSDAGAARGGLNSDRIKLTMTFLRQLQAHVRYVAWLNPMPKSRWVGTTAAEIARVLPMFDSTREGLDRVIDVLRGKQIGGFDARTEFRSGKQS
jgi:uncharacterized protein